METLQQLLDVIRRAFVWWFVVSPWEQSVRVRLGKHTQVLGPGIHFKIPFIDKVFTRSIRLRTADSGIQTLSTRDRKTLLVAATVKYSISDIALLFNTLHDASDTLIDLAAAEIADCVAAHTSEEVTPHMVQDYVNARLDFSQYGLAASKLAITDFAYVKTYRIVNQDRAWRDGMGLHTGRNREPD